MKTLSVILLFVFYFPVQKISTSKDVLQSMYNRYHATWRKSLHFNQSTGHYRNDSLLKTDTWFETIVYPDLLRIDIGAEKSTNGLLFVHDSTYAFTGNKITRAAKSENPLLFFLGGMYSKPFDVVLNHFGDLHIDLSKFHTGTWKGRPVYVLGADNDNDKINQVYIDQERLYAVRFLTYDGTNKHDYLFEQQIKVADSWTETKCLFYLNDKLLQTETYHNVVGNVPVDMKMFDPGLLGK